ncbi:MAG: outer membrane receptor for ferrienterochelin and colicin, partial [bacterium]
GQIEFPGLKGKYKLEIIAEKYDLYTEPEIEITGGMMAKASIQLLEKFGEIVEVTGESSNPIERLDQPAGELKLEQIKMIPALTRDFDGAIGTIPNVIRPPDGKVSIKGSREDQSALLINGADGTDPSTGGFTKNIPLESIGSVKVYTNPYLPEYGRFTGGVTKVETKRGGDKFKFDLTDFFPEPRFRGGKLFGFTNVSPRLTIAN